MLRFIIINMPLIFPLRGRLRLENARSGAWGQKTSSKHRRRPKSLVGKTRDTLWLRQDHSKKIRARGKASHTVVWSQRGNRCLRSKELSRSYGLKEEIVVWGQKNCYGRMVSKRKLPFKVKRIVMVVWSQRGNCRFRSKGTSQSYGPKEKIVILGQKNWHSCMVKKQFTNMIHFLFEISPKM